MKSTLVTPPLQHHNKCLANRFRKLQRKCQVSGRLPWGGAHGGVLTRELRGRGHGQDNSCLGNPAAHRHHHPQFACLPHLRPTLDPSASVSLKGRNGVECGSLTLLFLSQVSMSQESRVFEGLCQLRPTLKAFISVLNVSRDGGVFGVSTVFFMCLSKWK